MPGHQEIVPVRVRADLRERGVRHHEQRRAKSHRRDGKVRMGKGDLSSECYRFRSVPIDAELLEILACPNCKTPVKLVKNGTALKCGRCHRVYPIKDDIPVMLIDEATIEPRKQRVSGWPTANHGRSCWCGCG
mgnify:CR=1 FL=1